MLRCHGYLDRVVKLDDASSDEDPDAVGIDDLIGGRWGGSETRPNRTACHAQLHPNFFGIGSRKLERPFDQIDGFGCQ